ncbi:MAG: PilZ domain-containing protein [Mariprofundales bacterium]|nr:PilZ domain-containing protein [Mariprofundales bacterium]
MAKKKLEKELDNSRQDFRVNDVMPIRDEPLTHEEFEIKKHQIDARSRQSSMLQSMISKDMFNSEVRDHLNTELSDAMSQLDAKLNFLIGSNMINQAEQAQLKERPINLSCTGAALVPEHQYRRGEPVELIMQLSTFPPTTMQLIGKIMWIRKKETGEPFVGIKFIFRDQEEENSLARYVFKRNRESIRLKKIEDET